MLEWQVTLTCYMTMPWWTTYVDHPLDRLTHHSDRKATGRAAVRRRLLPSHLIAYWSPHPLDPLVQRICILRMSFGYDYPPIEILGLGTPTFRIPRLPVEWCATSVRGPTPWTACTPLADHPKGKTGMIHPLVRYLRYGTILVLGCSGTERSISP